MSNFSQGPFIKDGAELDLSADASLTAIGLTVSMGLLSATIQTGSGFSNTLEITASMKLKLVDPNSDGRITVSELPSAVSVDSPTGTITSPIKLDLAISAGVSGGGTSSATTNPVLASAELDLSFASDFTADRRFRSSGPGRSRPS